MLMEEEYLRDIGRQSERMVFNFLVLKWGLASVKWVSRVAREFGGAPDDAIDDGAGFDMLLSGVGGVAFEAQMRASFPDCSVVGRSNARELAVEVKGHALSSGVCVLSSNEHATMVARGAGFVVVIVDVFAKRVSHVWLNPQAEIASNRLSCTPRTMQLQEVKL